MYWSIHLHFGLTVASLSLAAGYSSVRSSDTQAAEDSGPPTGLTHTNFTQSALSVKIRMNPIG